MDIGSLIAAALLALGLIGGDAVLNSGTVKFDIQVTDDLSKRGFTAQLIDAMMDNYLKQLVEFKSIVRQPTIRSTQTKSLVGAVADALNMGNVTASFQDDLGLNPVSLSGSLMSSGKGTDDLRFILSGNSRYTGVFTIDELSNGRPLPVFLRDMSVRVVARLEPYAAALDQFHVFSRRLVEHTSQAGREDVNVFIARMLASEAGRRDSDAGDVDHAAFHNLLGLVAMMSQDPAPAEDAFKMATTLDPALGIPMINLGLLYVSEHRFDDAITMADASMKLRQVTSTPYLVSNAYTVKALALWGKGDVQGASNNFLAAVKVYPASLWGYFYWAELLDSAGNAKDANLIRSRAQNNLDVFETYPEVGFLHLRVLTGAGFGVQPIELDRVRHISEIYDQK